jgi:hypothetical protein
MTNGKFRVSFEVTDNWTIQGFRNFIKVLLSDENTFDVYIISNDDNSSYILKTGQNLSMDADHVKICNFESDKLQLIESLNIDIHLDNLQSFVMKIDELTPSSHGVLVTKNLNKYYLKPDYVLVFDRLMMEIKDGEI